MGDFFGGLRSGIQFPQVVMNQGPLPGAGGLPQPLHETPDARINYGSSLLGDLTPYAYGEPGYLSSQNAYLNIPHKIQKIVPVVYLPEAKVGAKEFFDLSHPIDDGDLAFVMRLDRSSLFCTGLKNADMRRAGLGTAIDPLINLCTLNYILSGLQLGINGQPGQGNLWTELFYNLDKQWFGKPTGVDSRDYATHPVGLDDVMHVIRHCIKPFGITRGSEKQGGQDEATISPATWPVSFVVSLTLDGKESNVVNIWHYHELHAGNDLVLRLRLMPLRPYTLNHYYKGVKRQNWDMRDKFVWQLVPDIFHIDMPKDDEMKEMRRIFQMAEPYIDEFGDEMYAIGRVRVHVDHIRNDTGRHYLTISEKTPWQELGFWHIGRSQIMTGKYGVEEFWHNDMANTLKTNHLDITLQPMFVQLPAVDRSLLTGRAVVRVGSKPERAQTMISARPVWTPTLGLERLGAGPESRPEARNQRRRIYHPPAPSVETGAAAEEAIPVPSLATVREPSGRPTEERGITAPSAERDDGPPIGASATQQMEEPEWLGRLEFTDGEPAAPAADPLLPGLGASAASATTSSSANGKKTTTKGQAAGKRGRPIGGSLLKPDGTSEASMVGML